MTTSLRRIAFVHEAGPHTGPARAKAAVPAAVTVGGAMWPAVRRSASS